MIVVSDFIRVKTEKGFVGSYVGQDTYIDERSLVLVSSPYRDQQDKFKVSDLGSGWCWCFGAIIGGRLFEFTYPIRDSELKSKSKSKIEMATQAADQAAEQECRKYFDLCVEALKKNSAGSAICA